MLNPCENGCLNLFDPANWSAVRWMSAAILGFITVMPLLLHQAWSFARPGLLPSERTWLRNWFIAGVFSVFLAVMSTIGLLFPFLFDTGHRTHESMQLDARYDAVSTCLSIVIAVVWSEIIVACASICNGAGRDVWECSMKRLQTGGEYEYMVWFSYFSSPHFQNLVVLQFY